MISVNHKGFKIFYDESRFSPKWKCKIKIPGKVPTETTIEKDQLKEIKDVIEECLSITQYKPVQIFNIGSDDLDRPYEDKSFKAKIASPRVRLNYHGESELQINGSSNEVSRSFIANEKNTEKVEQIIKLKKDFVSIRSQMYKLYAELKHISVDQLEEDKESLNSIIKKVKKATLTPTEKTKFIEKLFKESGKERLFCAAALKDAKWNYHTAMSKLKETKK